MLIAHCIRALIAVLGLAAVITPVASFNEIYTNETDPFYDFYRHKRTIRKQHKQMFDVHEKGQALNVLEHNKVKKKSHHPANHQLHPELHHHSVNRTGECCPTILEKVEPQGGSNQDGIFVELYQDQNYKQRFYELSCDPEVLDKPCRFINKRHDSRCVQKHSYTYALVKNMDSNRTKHFPMFPVHEHGGDTYTLDYIKVRSGCSCEVTPRFMSQKMGTRKKKNKKSSTDNT